MRDLQRGNGAADEGDMMMMIRLDRKLGILWDTTAQFISRPTCDFKIFFLCLFFSGCMPAKVHVECNMNHPVLYLEAYNLEIPANCERTLTLFNASSSRDMYARTYTQSRFLARFDIIKQLHGFIPLNMIPVPCSVVPFSTI